MKWNKRIRDLREDNDLTQEDLASQLGISKRTLLRYESGVSEPTISVLISLSLLFNVSVDYIIGHLLTALFQTTFGILMVTINFFKGAITNG